MSSPRGAEILFTSASRMGIAIPFQPPGTQSAARASGGYHDAIADAAAAAPEPEPRQTAAREEPGSSDSVAILAQAIRRSWR
eukprot:1300930-Pyramimonas_sp.AAC.1